MFGSPRQPKIDLATIDAPTEVDLTCVIRSPKLVTSPASGMRAAHVRLILLEWWGPLNHTSNSPTDQFSDLLGETRLGDGLELEPEGTDIRIFVRDFALPPAPTGGDRLVQGPLPAPFKTHSGAGRGELYLREQLFLSGERVRFVGFVGPVTELSDEGYRGGVARRLVAEPKMGPCRIEDTIRPFDGWSGRLSRFVRGSGA